MISDWEFVFIFLFTTAFDSWKEFLVTDRTFPSWRLKEDSWCFFFNSHVIVSDIIFSRDGSRWILFDSRFLSMSISGDAPPFWHELQFLYILCSSSSSLYKITLDYARDLSDLIFLDVVIHSSVMISSHDVFLLDTSKMSRIHERVKSARDKIHDQYTWEFAQKW